MSDTKPWTEAMMAALADGAWYDKEDILLIGALTVPPDRALEEMGERSLTMTPVRRTSAGARTVALQALQGRRRFGAVEFSRDGRVRKTGHDGVSIGHVAERVDRLEELCAEMRATIAQLVSRLGVEEPVVITVDNSPVNGVVKIDGADGDVVLELINQVNGFE